MNKFRFTIKLLVIATFLLAFTSIAQAQATRTWVSGVGDDVNPCSRTAPCKTYAGAISKTAANGEISTLDPGGFGAVTATKSITIEGTKGAGFGSILASGVSGVIVNDSATATPNTIRVILRNLSINGAATTAGSAIRLVSGKTLIVEDCQLFGFTGTPGTTGVGKGISVEGSASRNLVVRNTTIANCSQGIKMSTSGGVITAEIDNVQIAEPTANVSSAIEVGSNTVAVIRDSYLANYQSGVAVTAGSPASATLIRTTAFNTGAGLAVGSSTSNITSSSFINNTAGVTLAGGIIRTGCDNFFGGNTNDVTGGALSNFCVK